MSTHPEITAALVNGLHQAWACVLRSDSRAGVLELTSVSPMSLEFDIRGAQGGASTRSYCLDVRMDRQGFNVAFGIQDAERADGFDECLASCIAQTLPAAIDSYIPESTTQGDEDIGGAQQMAWPAGTTLH